MDFDKSIGNAINGIVAELVKPQNRDLLLKVVAHTGKDDSFMFTFTKSGKLDFDDWCHMSHVADELIVALGGQPKPFDTKDYDAYLAEEDNARLSEAQTAKFDALVNQFDDIGWSGAVYGLIMRQVQAHLRTMINN